MSAESGIATFRRVADCDVTTGAHAKIGSPSCYFEKMENAAFGIRMHSGWGVLVCISGEPR